MVLMKKMSVLYHLELVLNVRPLGGDDGLGVPED